MKPVEPGCEEREARVETTAGGQEADPALRACSSVLQRSTRSTRYSAATSGLSAAQPGELNFEQGSQRSSRIDAWLARDSVYDMVFTAIFCTGKCAKPFEGGRPGGEGSGWFVMAGWGMRSGVSPMRRWPGPVEDGIVRDVRGAACDSGDENQQHLSEDCRWVRPRGVWI